MISDWYSYIVISDRWGWGSETLRRGETCWDSCVHLTPWDFCGNFYHRRFRISMFAAMGYITPEYFKFPGELSPKLGLKFADIPNGLAAISKVWRCVKLCEDVCWILKFLFVASALACVCPWYFTWKNWTYLKLYITVRLLLRSFFSD